MTQHSKPPVLFLFSLLGIAGVMGLIWAIAFATPRHQTGFYLVARATSPASWEEFCVKVSVFSLRSVVVWADEEMATMSDCEQGPTIITQPVRELRKECPSGENCAPDGRFMQLGWDYEQKTAPSE